ncbi:CocE/NonD family hydrolase [Mycolicibacterium sp. CBMA 226]|uniref:S15 peptidase family protein n=1 Tax=Mycolicibacterium sp. CBMA 226 TaxID=2606611 RepID=UPI001FB72BB1|nr:CocE/NonD family hydrolase [Mycolicibacterium sp. CBMA 226]
MTAVVRTSITQTTPPPTTSPAPTASTSQLAALTTSARAQTSSSASVSPGPVATVATAVSHLAGSLGSPSVGGNPGAPADSPLAWTMLAATSKETFAPTAAVAPGVIDPVTHARVVATVQTPLLAPLQQIPIIGPLFVTPVVAFISQIPIISDVLHPIIGYPLQQGLPAGTPMPTDVMVTSFDGTQIYVHFMPATGLRAGQTAPTILDGPGLGMPGATNINGTFLDGPITDNLGAVGVAALRNAGYNVVTWDPRGEWQSGGVLQVDSPDFEAKDVSSIITWVATRPDVRLDGNPALLDPRIGMVGASYGGGIQLVAAATDPRIDAIVPTIAWHSLNTSLYKNDAFKSGWGTLLEAALLGTFARANPALLPAAIYGDLTGLITPSDQALLASRGPGDLVSKITAPTMLIQGTVDTLFTLQEADANAKTLIADGVPTKVIWFCGGHGVCTNDLLDPTDGRLIEQRTLQWLDRYVKGDTTVSTGPKFEFVDQHGQYYSSDVYPIPTGTPIVASSSGGHLPLVPFIGGSALLGVLPIGGGPAHNALNLTIPAGTTTTYVVGAPQLTLTYSGTGIASHVYGQLVDNTTGLVLGNQVTPIPVTLDGQTHTITVALEDVAQTLRPGQTLTLQLVASAADYQAIASLGVLNVSNMQLTLPTADPAAITPETVA